MSILTSLFQLSGVLSQYYIRYVGFEVLTAVFMKSIIFWDITPCSLLKVIIRFGGTYHLHLQARFPTSFHSGILLGLFDPEDGGDMYLRNIG
jgi:hypothetical protein